MDFSDQIIAEAIDYLVAHHHEQPALEFLARRAGYDSTHFQKLFKDRVGISPKRLIQYMNMRHARALLDGGLSTGEAAHETGLSGTGRLYDLFVTCNAVTPGEVQHRGRGLTITYGYHSTKLGEILVGQTGRGVCFLGFLVNEQRGAPFQKMKEHFPYAAFTADEDETAPAAEAIMRIWRGDGTDGEKLKLDLHGTNLQIQVWQALLKIPLGGFATYQSVAGDLGRPKAARAIGNAVGANPVSLLIPCHRVIRASGIIDNYGWGSPRKKLLLGLEQEMSGYRPSTSRML